MSYSFTNIIINIIGQFQKERYINTIFTALIWNAFIIAFSNTALRNF